MDSTERPIIDRHEMFHDFSQSTKSTTTCLFWATSAARSTPAIVDAQWAIHLWLNFGIIGQSKIAYPPVQIKNIRILWCACSERAFNDGSETFLAETCFPSWDWMDENIKMLIVRTSETSEVYNKELVLTARLNLPFAVH